MTDFQRITAAIHFIKINFKEQPTLDEIAAHIHLSPFHFQRLFKDWAGVSPKKIWVNGDFDLNVSRSGRCEKQLVTNSFFLGLSCLLQNFIFKTNQHATEL